MTHSIPTRRSSYLVVEKLNKAVLESLSDPALQQQFKRQGFFPAGLSADAASALLKSDYENWKVLVKAVRSEEHTSELQSLMRISYAVFCFKKQKIKHLNIRIKQISKTHIRP